MVMMADVEVAIADLEGSAVEASHACPDCNHPSCKRYRDDYAASRARIVSLFAEIEAERDFVNGKWEKDLLAEIFHLTAEIADLRALLVEVA